jgi:hypothetical protein
MDQSTPTQLLTIYALTDPDTGEVRCRPCRNSRSVVGAFRSQARHRGGIWATLA